MFVSVSLALHTECFARNLPAVEVPLYVDGDTTQLQLQHLILAKLRSELQSELKELKPGTTYRTYRMVLQRMIKGAALVLLTRLPRTTSAVGT